MPIFLRLARLVPTQNYGQVFGSSSFGQPTLGDKMTWLCAEIGLVFFMKVVVLCHSFLMVQKLGHLDLPRPSYG